MKQFLIVCMLMLVSVTPAKGAMITVKDTGNAGWVRATTTFKPTRMIIGDSGGLGYNGVAFFQMPTLAANEEISSAEMNFRTSNTGTVTNANIDIWSLGLQTTPTLATSHFIQSNMDATAGRDKLVDNFIVAGTFVNGVKSTGDLTSLGSFIQNLYTTLGYANVAGKYLYIRVNQDAVPTGGFRFYGGNEGAANAPALTLTTQTIVIPEPASLSLVAPAGLALLGRRRRA